MSEIRVNNITNRDGSTGTTVAGIPVVDSNSHFVVPTGRTGQRYVDGGENIVRDGLVLHLDAKYSYPSKTGITTTTASLDPDVYTWYDMSSYERNGSLEGTITYSVDGEGSLRFNSSSNSDRVTSQNTKGIVFANDNSDFTIDIWAKRTGDNGQFTTIAACWGQATDKDAWIVAHDSGTLHFTWDRYSSGSLFYQGGTLTLGEWKNIVVTKSGQVFTSFINNVSVASSEFPDTTTTDLKEPPLFEIGHYGNNNTSYFDGNISSVKIYNRHLSSTERTQNYNALKDRFGL